MQRDKIRLARECAWGSGAHTETLLWSDRFNVSVLQKFFYVLQLSGAHYVCIVFIKIYMF